MPPHPLTALLLGAATCGAATAREPLSPSIATVTHVGIWLGKPPLVRLDLDVALRNPGSKARWFFISGHVGPSGGGTRGISVYELPGEPPNALWQMEGMGGGWAVKLAPGTETTLRGLGIEAWIERLPPAVTIEVVVAEEIRIGDEPVAQWVGLPTGLIEGDHDAHIDTMISRALRWRENARGADGLTSESPLAFAGAASIPVQVALMADPTSRTKPPPANAFAWPDSWATHVGDTVTVEGEALDAKSGALLAGARPGAQIWIDGLDAWPSGFHQGRDRGRRVRVTGTVIERSDLPVFVEKPGEPKRTGIPMPEGTDLKDAGRRYLLKDATWTKLR